jgi:glycosyltransferase involved in cell wall biosynthesis
MEPSDNPSSDPGSVAVGPAGDATATVRTVLPFRPISSALAIVATVSVIIPARNEAANLPCVFRTIPPWINEIIVVDGHSVDDTVAVTSELCPQARVITQPGQGRGDALLAGFAAATGDILVAMEADGSTDGSELIQFVGALVCGADFVTGSRFSGSGGSPGITAARRHGNRLLGFLVNHMFKTRFTDLSYGYSAFWARHLDALGIDCTDFEVEALMSIRAAKAGLQIHEVPSFERPRLTGDSNLGVIRDGWQTLKLIVRERFAESASRPTEVESAIPLSSAVPIAPDGANTPAKAIAKGA